MTLVQIEYTSRSQYKCKQKTEICYWISLKHCYKPVASIGWKSEYQFCIMETKACIPTSVAHVTSHLTISRLRQFMVIKVIRMTCRPSSNAAFNAGICFGLSDGVAILNASWASLNNWEELCICLWADSNTVRSLVGESVIIMCVYHLPHNDQF